MCTCRKPNKTENSEWTGEGEPPANVMAKPSRFFMTVESVGSLKAHNIVIHGERRWSTNMPNVYVQALHNCWPNCAIFNTPFRWKCRIKR